MQSTTAKSIDRRIQGLISRGNHDVYEKKVGSGPYSVYPWVIYFYYISFLPDGQVSVKHYLEIEGAAIQPGQMPGKIKSIAKRVRDNDMTLKKIGNDFQKIEWEYKSYIAIFMDSPHWKILSRKNGKSAVVFNMNKSGTPNHSFFDADDYEIDMSDTKVPELRSAAYFVDHMKKSEFGDDLGYDQQGKKVKQQETFSFEVYFDVKGGAGGPAAVFVIDPDGTNLGPPLPPP